jgi:hypothetical protein
MKRVEFITIEDEPDLIVSFAIAPSAHRSLTLLRSPQYETLIPEYERVVSVSFDPSEVDGDSLRSVQWGQTSVTVKTARHKYKLDISAVKAIEITEAKTVLRKMVKDVATYVDCD